MNRCVLVEACVGSAADAIAADTCGVDRIEISTGLEADGLTPPAALIESVLGAVRARVVVLIRARPGGFVYSEGEVGAMCRDAAVAATLGVEGVAIGALDTEGGLDVDAMRRMGEAARSGNPDVTLVCHRAFDRVRNFEEAIGELGAMGFARVLTSGGRATAGEGAAVIGGLQRRTGLELVPAGGVRPDNIRAIARETGCRSIHGTFRAGSGDGSVRLDPDALSAAVRALRGS